MNIGFLNTMGAGHSILLGREISILGSCILGGRTKHIVGEGDMNIGFLHTRDKET